MRAALLLALAAVTAWGDPGPRPRFTTRDCSRLGSRSSRGFPCDNYAFFELAPLSGAGMGSACACAAVTGAKGEAVTWVRASTGACFPSGVSGAVSTGGQDCGNNLPRIERAPDGTLAFLVEPVRTNLLIRNQEISDVAWTAGFSGTGTSTAVVTANFGTDPFGGSTADRVQVSACPNANSESDVAQTYTGSAATFAGHLLIKGTSGSGSIRASLYDTTAAAGTSILCNYNSTTWTWCGGPVAGGGNPGLLTRAFANATHKFVFGCINYASTGGSDTGAADFLAWRPQSELGGFPTTPILTVAASAKRSQDYGSVDLGASAPAGNLLSLAATLVPLWTASQGESGFPQAVQVNHISTSDTTAGTSVLSPGLSGSSWRAYTANTTPTAFTTSTNAVTITAGAAHRGALWADGSVLNGYMGGVNFTASGALSGSWSPARYLTIGGPVSAASGAPHGLIYGICDDPSPTRCR